MVATMERLRYAMLLFQQRAKLTQLWNEKFQLQQQRQQDSNIKIEEVKRKAGKLRVIQYLVFPWIDT